MASSSLLVHNFVASIPLFVSMIVFVCLIELSGPRGIRIPQMHSRWHAADPIVHTLQSHCNRTAQSDRRHASEGAFAECGSLLVQTIQPSIQNEQLYIFLYRKWNSHLFKMRFSILAWKWNSHFCYKLIPHFDPTMNLSIFVRNIYWFLLIRKRIFPFSMTIR